MRFRVSTGQIGNTWFGVVINAKGEIAIRGNPATNRADAIDFLAEELERLTDEARSLQSRVGFGAQKAVKA
jgi:hypothetical protein